MENVLRQQVKQWHLSWL